MGQRAGPSPLLAATAAVWAVVALLLLAGYTHPLLPTARHRLDTDTRTPRAVTTAAAAAATAGPPDTRPVPPPPPYTGPDPRQRLSARYEAACGSQPWAVAYQRRHTPWEAMRGRPHGERRAVTYRCHAEDNCSGLGDRLSGIGSAFAYALATNRSLYLDWPMAHHALTAGQVDWRFGQGGPPAGWAVSHVNLVHCLKGFSRRRCTQYFVELLKNRLPVEQRGDGEVAPEDADLVELRATRGRLTTLLTERALAKHGAPLLAAGMDPRTAFGCALHLHFRPADAVVARVLDTARQLVAPNTITIGIHVRVGDRSLVKALESEVGDLERYWEYAQRIEDSLQGGLAPGQEVRWLLVSDTVWVRDEARRRFGDKVLVTAVVPVHTNAKWEAGRRHRQRSDGADGMAEEGEGDAGGAQEEVAALQSSLGEWWLFSLCSYFVFNPFSGFSRSAAAYSLRPGPVVAAVRKDPAAAFRLEPVDAFRDHGSMF